jgi:hypothetical protein
MPQSKSFRLSQPSAESLLVFDEVEIATFFELADDLQRRPVDIPPMVVPLPYLLQAIVHDVDSWLLIDVDGLDPAVVPQDAKAGRVPVRVAVDSRHHPPALLLDRRVHVVVATSNLHELLDFLLSSRVVFHQLVHSRNHYVLVVEELLVGLGLSIGIPEFTLPEKSQSLPRLAFVTIGKSYIGQCGFFELFGELCGLSSNSEV